MTWDNYGEWHIDHIKPLSLATTEEEVISCGKSRPKTSEDNIIGNRPRQNPEKQMDKIKLIV